MRRTRRTRTEEPSTRDACSAPTSTTPPPARRPPAPGPIDPRLRPTVDALLNLLVADLVRHPATTLAPPAELPSGKPGAEPSPQEPEPDRSRVGRLE